MLDTGSEEYIQAVQREEKRMDRLVRSGVKEEYFNHPIENRRGKMELKSYAQINFRADEETVCESIEVKKLGWTHEAIYKEGLKCIFSNLNPKEVDNG